MMPTFIKEILSIILAVRLFPFENLIKRQLKGHDIKHHPGRIALILLNTGSDLQLIVEDMLQENVYILRSGEAEAQEPGYSRQSGTKVMYTLRENSSVTPVLRWQDIYGQF